MPNYTIDENCRIFFQRACAAALRCKKEKAAALDAILFSAVALEAFPNAFVTMTGSYFGKKGYLLSSLIAAHDILRDLEEQQVQVRTKYDILHYVLVGKTFNRGSQPWQDFNFLIRLRNELVHPKSGLIEHADPPIYEKLPAKLIAELRARNISHLPHKERTVHQWMRHLENEKAAAWALNTTKAMVLTMCNAIPFPNQPVVHLFMNEFEQWKG